MADGSDREVTQADQNDINSQWSLFFTDLDELLSEYEQHRSTNDIAITENLTIRLENVVRAQAPQTENTWCMRQLVYIENCMGKSPIVKKIV